MSANDALRKITAVLKNYNPTQPFEYKFVDENMQKNLVMKNALAISQAFLPCWLFLFPVWVCLD